MFKKLIDQRDSGIAKSNARRAVRLGIERLENRAMMAADANLVAYRPVTNYINYANYPVADTAEADASRGPGIRINGDDDNLNNVVEYRDAGPIYSIGIRASRALDIAWSSRLTLTRFVGTVFWG